MYLRKTVKTVEELSNIVYLLMLGNEVNDSMCNRLSGIQTLTNTLIDHKEFMVKDEQLKEIIEKEEKYILESIFLLVDDINMTSTNINIKIFFNGENGFNIYITYIR